MSADVAYKSPGGRWLIAAAVLGSGIVFLDGTVVNVALPAIGTDLHASVRGMQWIVDAYLVTLSALMLLGGSMGDRFGRRKIFLLGLGGFVAGSIVCGAAPNTGALIVARAVQGVGGAFLVPGSLALISATIKSEDRAVAVGAWSGLAGVSTALGPFIGGWLIDAVSWRLIFLINVPLAVAAALITLRHVPESRTDDNVAPDVAGAVAISAGLALVAFGLIEHVIVPGVVGVAFIVAFVVIEHRSAHPMLPLSILRSRQFAGVNLTTFVLYGGLSGALFFVVLRLEVSLGYSALEAGMALLPFTAVMLVLSPTAGRVGQRIGPRLPMTLGPLLAASGLFLFGRISAGDHFVVAVLPGVLLFGLGMTITVAPLTAAVLSSVDEQRAGVASGVNNAVSRIAGLIAIAVLPAVAHVGGASLARSLDRGFATGLDICAVAAAIGGLIAFIFVSSETSADRTVRAVVHPSPNHACGDPCLSERAA